MTPKQPPRPAVAAACGTGRRKICDGVLRQFDTFCR